MDWLQFIAAIVGHLAWPAVVIVLLILVRHQIRGLAERLLEFSIGGAKVTFDKALQKGSEIIEETPLVELEAQPQLPPPVGDAEQKVPIPRGRAFTTDSAETGLQGYALWLTTAAGRIISAYESLERLLDEVAKDLGFQTGRPSKIMHFLVAEGKFDRKMLDLYRALREGRNAIAGARALPNLVEVAEYERQASYLRSALEGLRAELRVGKEKQA
jgi:hypothetical protein